MQVNCFQRITLRKRYALLNESCQKWTSNNNSIHIKRDAHNAALQRTYVGTVRLYHIGRNIFTHISGLENAIGRQ